MTTATRDITRGTTASLTLFAAIWTVVSFAQPTMAQVLDRVADRFQAGSIRSVIEADAALSAVATERVVIEARYLADEQACHPKFFTTSCIEQAKERRRVAMSELRAIEIEANAFKRQTRAAEREKALAERLEKIEQTHQERASGLPAAVLGTTGTVPDDYSRKVHSTQFPERDDKHGAKMKRQKAEDAINAQKRAANVAAYEKKKRDALERQQKVVQRKAEKEQKRKATQGENGKPD